MASVFTYQWKFCVVIREQKGEDVYASQHQWGKYERKAEVNL